MCSQTTDFDFSVRKADTQRFVIYMYIILWNLHTILQRMNLAFLSSSYSVIDKGFYPMIHFVITEISGTKSRQSSLEAHF